MRRTITINPRRAIKASTQLDGMCEEFLKQINDRLSKIGYAATGVDGTSLADLKISVSYVGSEDASYLPTIELTPITCDGVSYELAEHVEFPDLNCAEGAAYDEISYWIDRWSAIGKALTRVAELIYDSTSYGL